MSVAARLAEALSTVRQPGDFCVSGKAEILAPSIEVDGVGPVALPLLPLQAERLVAVAERAPFGRGEATIVDTAVRRTWQIGAGRVRLGGRHWKSTLDGIVARVAAGFGLGDTIVAELYKLLVYDEGSFFRSHRDTEKAPGMFATLVVAMPSVSEGGDLVVRHRGAETRLDLRTSDPSEAAFAAFYADCVHEVLPVTSGCRLALVFNLVRRGAGATPQPPDYGTERERLGALLADWRNDPAAPDKAVCLLDHAYTPAELGFGSLKGADAGRVDVLAAAAAEAGCVLSLALLTIEESGIAEVSEAAAYGRRRWPAEDELEAGEVLDRAVLLSEWRCRDGFEVPPDPLPVEDDEVVPPDGLDELEPDEEYFQEATGNEGASFERTYRRAVAVLWPGERLPAVLCQAGLRVTVPRLRALTERWEAAGEPAGSSPWQAAHELGRIMVERLAVEAWWPYGDGEQSAAAVLLELLLRLRDVEGIESLLAAMPVGEKRQGLQEADQAAILSAVGALPAERRAGHLERIVAGTAHVSPEACAALLAAAAGDASAERRDELRAAAAALVDAVPAADPDGARDRRYRGWGRDPWAAPELVVRLLTALSAVEPALAERAAERILAAPDRFGLDSVVVPAAVALAATSLARDAAVGRLRAAAVAHLDARVAVPLAPPSDWSRPAGISCPCPNCAALSRFLADPAEKTWTLKAVAHVREHVEATIRRAGCDIDAKTLRKGSPLTLLCTKNRATHDRLAAQRERDLEALASLSG